MSSITREENDLICDHIRAARRIMEWTLGSCGSDRRIADMMEEIIGELEVALDELGCGVGDIEVR
ncbi:MAG: hypothetical protein JXA22_01805 [Candidatus Thermoplasmatota archaeon]|nr:hypothetical protein [Candidatus Thermoplasmatota archaeon]